MARTLTVRQPWAHLIIEGGKDVENRSWATSYRGTVLIHAGQRFERDGVIFAEKLGISVSTELPRGLILGSVELIACVLDSTSPWAIKGMWHWILANPKPVREQVWIKGQLGLQEAPADWQTLF